MVAGLFPHPEPVPGSEHTLLYLYAHDVSMSAFGVGKAERRRQGSTSVGQGSAKQQPDESHPNRMRTLAGRNDDR